MHTIYLIECASKHTGYVGQTSRSFQIRYDEHWETAKRPEYQDYPMYKDFNTLGRDAFTVRKLDSFNNAADANIWEIYYISIYSERMHLYNSLKGGGYGSEKIARPLEIYTLFEHTKVKEYETYQDVAKDLRTNNATVIRAAIDMLPICEYWITFTSRVSFLNLFWRTYASRVFEESYWNRNYSKEAMIRKRLRRIDPEAFTYREGIEYSLKQW